MSDDTEPTTEEYGQTEWPLRPWVLALMLAIAGLLVHLFTYEADGDPWRMAFTAAVIFGSLAAAFTLSDKLWIPAQAIYSTLVALVMGGIAWRAASAGDRYSDAGFWVAAGVLAIILSLPLFQAGFHRLRWKTSYKATHFHVWTDAITGAGAFAFVGLSWALLAVLAELFKVIRIELLSDLIDEGWFAWMFSGAAFGAALGVLRNQLKIIGTLQNVVLLVLSILAVPLAVALVIFLLAVLVSGLDVLWEATSSATPLLLAIAVGCFVLTNAVVRDDDEEASNSRILRIAGFVLAVGILPLAMMASISMGTRIAQHGLSPERLWALIAIAVAVAYGVAYFVSAIRGRKEGWRDFLRRSNLHLAVLTGGIALLLALPIFNFGSISASNQIARLDAGKVSVEDFDYAALRWDFGEAGRAALERLAEREGEIGTEAQAALDETIRSYRWRETKPSERRENIRVQSDDPVWEERIRAQLQGSSWSCDTPCFALDFGTNEDGDRVIKVIEGQGVGNWLIKPQDSDYRLEREYRSRPPMEGRLGRESEVEIREWTGRRIYIDGEPVGEPFE